MKYKEIDLFVPGRLCLLGEHSDWAGKYRSINHKIEKGYAIVTGIEEGIYAKVKICDKFIVKEDFRAKKKKLECDMNLNELIDIAENDKYWCYVAGVAASIKELYNIGGVEITIYKNTLPIKKGLSSSAAICVLVARAFNQLYNLHLNTQGEMNIAYNGEILTPSRCGRLDQACAFGKKPVLMIFDGDRLDIKPIKIGADFHFVFADLMSKKNTIKILSDLNRCFPFPQNEIEKKVHQGLGKINKKIIDKGLKYLENGDHEGFGKLMNEAQKTFDDYVAPACKEELRAPILHETLKDKRIKDLTYGGKGVGSQGDGTIQFLAKDKECQILLKEYLSKELKMSAYSLTINKTRPIKKAIIPVAGNGTRMYPMTKIIKKAFLPVPGKDNIIKPAIMNLLEELYDSGIEKICLIIDKDDRQMYDELFEKTLTTDLLSKLSPIQLEYENKIQKIGQRVEYIVQDEKLGLGHAVYLCKDFVKKDPVLLVLGDQLFKTKCNVSCTEQLLDCYNAHNGLTISVTNVPLEDVNKYGILCGKNNVNNSTFPVDIMVEKPDIDYAQRELFTMTHGVKMYYSVFGEYILTPSVFKELEYNFKNKITSLGEFQLTTALDKVRSYEGMTACIMNGEMLDIGNSTAYVKTFSKLSEIE